MKDIKIHSFEPDNIVTSKGSSLHQYENACNYTIWM